MDTAQDNKSSKDRRQESAGPRPLEPFTQLVLRGFEHLAVTYVLGKSSKPTKARRQRRPAKASDAPYPDQLSLPL